MGQHAVADDPGACNAVACPAPPLPEGTGDVADAQPLEVSRRERDQAYCCATAWLDSAQTHKLLCEVSVVFPGAARAAALTVPHPRSRRAGSVLSDGPVMEKGCMPPTISQLLINEPPLQVLPSLAVHVGLNEAIILQQLHFRLQISEHIIDERPWYYNSYEEWKMQFPFWSMRTIRRTIIHLERLGYLTAGNFNRKKSDQTKWYTIDYERLNKLGNISGGQIGQATGSSWPPGEVNLATSFPKTSSKTSSKKDKKEYNGAFGHKPPKARAPLYGQILSRTNITKS